MILEGAVEARDRFEVGRALLAALPGARLRVRVGDYRRPGAYAYAREHREADLGDYLAHLDGAADELGYAANQPIERAVAETLAPSPAVAPREALGQPALWIGGAGAETPLHKDSGDNFAVHLLGAKRWTLFPVRDAPHLALRRTVAELTYADFAPSAVDVRAPDPALAPSFDQAVSVVETVRAGEALYVPAGWSHHVATLAPSVMVNYWVDGRRAPPAALSPWPPDAVAVLTDPALRDAAYRLRYAVFAEEHRDDCYADRASRRWMDAFDARDDGTLLGAIDGSAVVGTARLVSRRAAGRVLGGAHYQWEELAARTRETPARARGRRRA